MNTVAIAPTPPAAGPLAQWSGLIETMLDAVWLVDARTLRVAAANRAAVVLAAMPLAEIVGKDVLELAATPEDLCFWGDTAQGLAGQIESDTLLMRGDGSTVAVTRRVSPIAADGSAPAGTRSAAIYVVAMHDRSAMVLALAELEGTAADLRATLESTQDGLLVTDLAGRIRNFNQRFASLWQIPLELLGQHDDDAVLEWMRRSVTEPSAYLRRLATIDDATMLQARDVLRLHSGVVLERVTTPQCLRGRPIGRVFSFRDITEQIEAHQRIQTLSYTDTLTGLPNRRLLADRVEVALAMAKRDGTPFALLFLNLDRFNHINETLGRVLGDRVLLDVADRIKGCVRQIDTVARLGGDEFVVVANQADDNGAEATAWRLMEALKQPFTQGGMSFTVTASVGISLFPNDGSSLDELVRHSDAAMREVKLAGRAGFRFHRSRPAHVDNRSRSRMQLDHAMRLGLAQGRLRLHYQPQIDLRSGRIVGAEALLRWRDPELGEIAPGEFIPVAEESGFIVPIGEWVLKRAVAQAASWLGAGRPMTISVNVSALQFQQPGFVDGVAAVLREAELPPRWLELELTESILIQDAQDAMLRLQALAQLGVKLAIDDFGTGYSSLAYLKRFPIGRLKIDRSFVNGLPGEDSDVAIVQAIIHMGRALRLEIVAEGVESESQRQFLQRSGCDLYQGYLYAPALDVVAFEDRLRQDARPGAGPSDGSDSPALPVPTR
jgi:diguanylate cyclase (GGDEF)-like protein/PAS domain S-box-containing protein